MATGSTEIALTQVQMHLHTPADPAVGVCVSNERCTASKKAAHFVRHVAFDVSGTRLEGNFRAGQSFGVLPPGVDEKGRPHKLRLYSIASPSAGEDGKGRIVATTVKRTIDEHWETGKLFLGVASNYLCDLKPGDRVPLTGPSGKRFVLPADAGNHDYVFFATGTGIAPFRGMLMELLANPVGGAKGGVGEAAGIGGGGTGGGRIVLVMGAAYATDLLYDQTFLDMAARHPRFTYLTAISREQQRDGQGPMYVQNRVRTNADLIVPLLEGERTLVYICGLAGMELGILQEMARRLSPSALEQYVHADAAALANVAGWERRMLHKEVKPTRRVFLEVY